MVHASHVEGTAQHHEYAMKPSRQDNHGRPEGGGGGIPCGPGSAKCRGVRAIRIVKLSWYDINSNSVYENVSLPLPGTLNNEQTDGTISFVGRLASNPRAVVAFQGGTPMNIVESVYSLHIRVHLT